MFTYILPSILSTNRIHSQLVDVLNHRLIEKVILVTQNSVGKYDLQHDKLINIVADEYSFCNGKWNMGYEYGVYTENLILATDDINYDTEIFDRVGNLNLRDYGIIGAGAEFKQVISRTHGFGQLMFMKKEHFTPIPEGIKHWFGDDWIFYNMSLLKMPNYTIDIQIGTNLSESSQSQIVQERIAEDFKYWDTIKEPFKPFFYQ